MKKAIKFIHTVNHIRIRITWGLLKNIISQAPPHSSTSVSEGVLGILWNPSFPASSDTSRFERDYTEQCAYFKRSNSSPSCDQRFLWRRSYGVGSSLHCHHLSFPKLCREPWGLGTVLETQLRPCPALLFSPSFCPQSQILLAWGFNCGSRC